MVSISMAKLTRPSEYMMNLGQFQMYAACMTLTISNYLFLPIVKFIFLVEQTASIKLLGDIFCPDAKYMNRRHEVIYSIEEGPGNNPILPKQRRQPNRLSPFPATA
jgi:hypothetical protein